MLRSRRSSGGLLSSLLVAAVVAGSLLLAGKALLDPPRAAAGGAWVVSWSSDAAQPGSVLFLGGALAAGGDASPASEAAEALELPATVLDHGDAGYAATGTDGTPPLARQAQTDIADPEIDAVVIQGHARDLAAPARTVKLAALHLIDRLRVTVSPTTRLVMLAPLPPASGDPVGAAAVRTALREAAREKRVHFADPVTDGWVTQPVDTAEFTAGLVVYLQKLDIRPT